MSIYTLDPNRERHYLKFKLWFIQTRLSRKEEMTSSCSQSECFKQMSANGTARTRCAFSVLSETRQKYPDEVECIMEEVCVPCGFGVYGISVGGDRNTKKCACQVWHSFHIGDPHISVDCRGSKKFFFFSVHFLNILPLNVNICHIVHPLPLTAIFVSIREGF